MKNSIKKTLQTTLLILISTTIGSFLSVYIYSNKIEKNNVYYPETKTPVSLTSVQVTGSTDLTIAAEKSINAVVHVKTTYETKGMSASPFYNDPFFEFFFGRPDMQQQPKTQTGSGSGVIISPDGYIVTNNHVVNNASKIEVTLNDKRTFEATIIGSDLTTDITLLKIETENLPVISLGNSDELKIGEWVLAVGNPFNLNSTVTAGIVSAKAREINILNSDMRIESFIQTDAAVNPGNSGGALVNSSGELVGINTAIASKTGSYEGYSFAIPTSIVGKVIADLKEFGTVQRALLGVTIQDVTSELAKEKKLQTLDGIYVYGTTADGAAKDAGIKEGDIITHINGIKVNTSVELRELISRYRPGDKVTITVLRDNKSRDFSVTLRNTSGNTNIIKGADISVLGASFKELSPEQKIKYQVNGGVLVESVEKGKFASAKIPKGFIIYKINSKQISSVNDISKVLEEAMNSDDNVLFITGVSLNGKIMHYAISLED